MYEVLHSYSVQQIHLHSANGYRNGKTASNAKQDLKPISPNVELHPVPMLACFDCTENINLYVHLNITRIVALVRLK